MNCATVINKALEDLLRKSEQVLLFGEDIEDPYGGAFKITKNLSSIFPGRVVSTPISEPGLAGVCTGLSMEGFIPVLEIMFGDFLSLVFDQVLNHLTKFKGMYDHKVSPHVVIRAPMGGGRGYGPTHSQCMEKYFLGIPGLDIIAFSEFHDIPAIYEEAVLGPARPVLLAEHKNVYGQKYRNTGDDMAMMEKKDFAAFSYTDFRYDKVLILTYGGMTGLCLDAAKEALYEHEIYSTVVSINRLKPFNTGSLEQFMSKGKRVLIVEEGGGANGWSSYMLAMLHDDDLIARHNLQVKRVCSLDYIIPSAKSLEEMVIVNKQRIMNVLLNGRR